METLFVYGTLCFQEIVAKLTGKAFKSEKAVLKKYERRKVRNADYPALIENPNSEVEGILLLNVDEQSMKILSFYEGEEYNCKELTVIVKGKLVDAKVFIWCSDINELENIDWSPNEFLEKSLNIYVEKVIPDTILEYNQK